MVRKGNKEELNDWNFFQYSLGLTNFWSFIKVVIFLQWRKREICECVHPKSANMSEEYMS